MRLSQLFKWIMFFTMVALVYIHMQMKIIHLAYQGKSKEIHIRSLLEDNGYLTYKILSMKSASNLGYKLLSDDSDMEFVNPDNVKILSTSRQISTDSQMLAKEDKPNMIVSLLSFGAQAEAKVRE